MTDSTILKIDLQTTGSNSGTWGTKTNENLQKVEETLKGFIAVPITGTTTTLSNPSGGDGSTSQTAKIVLSLTGTLAAPSTVECEASVDNFYLIQDLTTRAGNTLLFGPAGGTKVTLVEGAKHLIFVDGGSNAAIDVFSDMGNVTAGGTLSAVGNVTLNGGTLSFNASAADRDATFAGQAQANLLKIDASTDRVGIATGTPATVLDVAGTFRATGAAQFTSTLTASTTNITDANFTFNDNGGNHDARFEGAADPNLLMIDGSADLIGIGVSTPANAKLEINQNSTLGAIACLSLDQDDTDQEFIYFDGTSAGDSTSSLSSSTGTTGGKQGAIRVNINGVDRWLRFYDTAV
jgi:hypothetical protein